MYHFFKKHQQKTSVRVQSTHVIRCFKGRCLVTSEDENIAIWLNKDEVAYKDHYIEFNLEHNKNYFVSELYRMLSEEDYHQEYNEYKGSYLVSLFPKKKDHLTAENSQDSIH